MNINLSNSIYVTDPCYTPDTWCQKLVNNIKPGIYYCNIITNDEGRVSSLEIVHKDYKNFTGVLSLISSKIGVDSGQAGFFDKEYFEKHYNSDDWYDKICDITSSTGGTIEGLGVVSSSGYGDGMYELYGMKKDNMWINLVLVFIENEDC